MSIGPDILFNDDGSFRFEGGDLAVGVSLAQAIEVSLSAFRGEWFLEPEFGVPYLEVVFQKPINLGHIDSVLRRAILNTPGVVRILSFDSQLDGSARALDVSYTVEGAEGIVEGQVTGVAIQ